MKAYITFRNTDYWVSADPEIGAVEVEIDDCLYAIVRSTQASYIQMQQVLSELFEQNWKNARLFAKDVTVPDPTETVGPVTW